MQGGREGVQCTSGVPTLQISSMHIKVRPRRPLLVPPYRSPLLLTAEMATPAGSSCTGVSAQVMSTPACFPVSPPASERDSEAAAFTEHQLAARGGRDHTPSRRQPDTRHTCELEPKSAKMGSCRRHLTSWEDRGLLGPCIHERPKATGVCHVASEGGRWV